MGQRQLVKDVGSAAIPSAELQAVGGHGQSLLLPVYPVLRAICYVYIQLILDEYLCN